MSTASFSLDEFHPMMPGFEQSPYPFYERLREVGPVVWLPKLNAYWAVGHAEVGRVFSDRHFGLLPKNPPPPPPGQLPPSMLFTDPPTHTRLRSLVSKAFTPRTVERLRPHIEELVDQMLTAAARDGRVDVARDIAFPLPATVIAELLGVPVQDRDQFREWSAAIIRSSDAGSPPEAREAGPAASLALAQYFEQLIAQRRREPRHDMLSELVAAEESGEKLSHGELLSTCILLLIAGHETTTGLLTNGTHGLMQQPEQWERLSSEPALLHRAVEELLRFDSPVQRMGRRVQEETELGGVHLKEGDSVLAVIGAANRDPSVFSEPHRLDLGRDPNPHLAFGRGIHYCLGAPLARLEAEVAFGEMARRFPRMRLDPDGKPAFSGNTRFRSMTSLPVRVD